MKIYIETEMTELPKGCKRYIRNYGVECCSLVNYCNENFAEEGHSPYYTKDGIRPDWCPLRTETEIAEQEVTK